MYRYGAALALAALVASGCSEEHAGSLPPPVSATPSATPTPTPTNPTSEVEAAARAYFAALERAGKTGDVAALEPMLAASCPCRDQITYIKREAAAGHRITTTYRVEDVRPHDVAAAAAAVTVTFSSPPSTVTDTAGHIVRRIGGGEHIGMDLSLTRGASGWVVARVVRLGA
jgi:hypothetical protein